MTIKFKKASQKELAKMRKIDIFDAVTDAVSVAGVDVVDSDTAGRLIVLSSRGGARVECGAWFNSRGDLMKEFAQIVNISGLHIMDHDDIVALWRACDGWLAEVAWVDGFKAVDEVTAAHDAAAGVTLIAFSGKLEN